MYENEREFEADRAPGREPKPERADEAASATYDAPAAAAGRVDAVGSGGVARLQRSAGNAAVATAVQRSPVQRSSVQRSAVQRSAVQRSSVQRSAVQRSSVQETISRPGKSLPGEVREPLERGFGRPLDHVQLHDDADALSSARDVGAYAYASGDHIVVPPGAPLETYAEETEHTFQQRSGPVAGSPDGKGHLVSDPSDSFETAAKAKAGEVLSVAGATDAGAQAPAVPAPAVQRQTEEERQTEAPVVQRQEAEEEVEEEPVA